MLQSTVADEERQEDEILALSSICDCNEFSYNKQDTIQCCCNVFLDICGPLEIKNIYDSDEKPTADSSSQKYFIEHLPPVRLYLQLPKDYPSKNPPKFYLTISWLPPWETSFVCQKLDEIWQQKEGNEILFLWLEFLRNDLLSFLRIRDTLDISFMYMMYIAPNDYLKSNLTSLSDIRAINRALFLNPIQFLMDYNKDQHKVEFEKNFHKCSICFEEHNGQKCIKLESCGHVYCKECVQQYITLKIKERVIKTIACPDSNCALEITVNEVKELCPHLFSKYEELMLQVTLRTMSDVVFCPRILCQHPVIRDADDTLAICNSCGYSFCSYCYKLYHGVTPCDMTSNDTLKLIKEYQSSDRHQKKLLEKKYGRKQIQIVVEKYLTKEYLKDNAKPCPQCQTLTTKIDGCNKMICVHCHASFCWLCGIHITMQNAYDHFTMYNSKCYGRLFEGIHDVGLDNLDDIDIEENMLI